jgi:NAD(P)H-dependent FMN reductase
MSERPLIQVILGSTRPGRFSEKAGAWVVDRLGSRDDLEVELLDLRDFPMPLYEHERPPAYGHREYTPEVDLWAQAVERGDGYIVVSPEYNHGYAAVLKNAFDNVFPEFNRKPVTFVGYGNSGGARAIEQLRLVAVELEMAPLRHAVHILPALMVPAIKAEGDLDVELFASLDEKLTVVVDDLLWWARALGEARSRGSE